MLLKQFDLTDKKSHNKLYFDKEKHLTTWDHYCDCYSYTLQKIFNNCLISSYAFNCRARGIMFLMRHYFEICLKRNIILNGYQIPNTHDLVKLMSSFKDQELIPIEFREVALKLNYDSDGTCFRYYINKENSKPFFNFDDKIDLSELIKKYNCIKTSESFRIEQICESFDYDNKRKKWALTLHMGECRGLGHIRTQYDDVIEILLDGILLNNYDLNKIYLPLLFLVRHSLEIALKFNIEEAKKNTSIVSTKNIVKIHSLEQLYNIFGGSDGYINKLNIERMNIKTKEQYEVYKMQYEKLNSTLHQLDKNSMFFRFPVDNKGNNHPINLRKNSILNILQLYCFTDTFITFANDVLIEEGLFIK